MIPGVRSIGLASVGESRVREGVTRESKSPTRWKAEGRELALAHALHGALAPRVESFPRHTHTMTTLLRRAARPSAFTGICRTGSRAMSSQFGFPTGYAPQQQQQQQQPRAAALPIPYVTETVVRPLCLPPLH